MKTIEQIIEGFQPSAIDCRDLNRLSQFLNNDQLKKICASNPDIQIEVDDSVYREVVPYTRENVLKQLQRDVAFGFEKALDKRGISAGLMYEVVKMWCGILEEGLEDFDSYAMYGLPLFKAVAVKYGFDNPIGDNSGSEDFYNCD